MIPAFEDLNVRIALYAVVSLTLVRMVRVALALVGTRQGGRRWCSSVGSDRVGWPRFALLAIEELGGTDPRVIVAVTIVFSVIAHGITARPLATRYLAGLSKSAHRTSAIVPASESDR